MTKFIELTKFHGAPPNNKVWINVAAIRTIEKYEAHGETRYVISMGTDDDELWAVTETPEEIMALIGSQPDGLTDAAMKWLRDKEQDA